MKKKLLLFLGLCDSLLKTECGPTEKRFCEAVQKCNEAPNANGTTPWDRQKQTGLPTQQVQPQVQTPVSPVECVTEGVPQPQQMPVSAPAIMREQPRYEQMEQSPLRQPFIRQPGYQQLPQQPLFQSSPFLPQVEERAPRPKRRHSRNESRRHSRNKSRRPRRREPERQAPSRAIIEKVLDKMRPAKQQAREVCIDPSELEVARPRKTPLEKKIETTIGKKLENIENDIIKKAGEKIKKLEKNREKKKKEGLMLKMQDSLNKNLVKLGRESGEMTKMLRRLRKRRKRRELDECRDLGNLRLGGKVRGGLDLGGMGEELPTRRRRRRRRQDSGLDLDTDERFECVPTGRRRKRKRKSSIDSLPDTKGLMKLLEKIKPEKKKKKKEKESSL
ncbi:MAG: uncharacterized protein A8A55_1940 [Amphiamblys sp. WSBS2006]|nr:MAG: uncharacterized protein A8A55_1940 [Amphiamblys sp. WSBS2006]